MKIALAADHGGFDMKAVLIARLDDAGHSVTDSGALEPDPADDYPDVALATQHIRWELNDLARRLDKCARRHGAPRGARAGAGQQRHRPHSGRPPHAPVGGEGGYGCAILAPTRIEEPGNGSRIAGATTP